MKVYRARNHRANKGKPLASLSRNVGRATPTEHVHTPSSGAVRWVGSHAGRQEVVDAPSWFAAREVLARVFGCGPGGVEVKRA